MMSSAYAATVMQSLLEFQKSGYLCDTVLVVDDGQLKAHSAVLAAVSPVFNAALRRDVNSVEHTVILSGVGSYVANIVLHFIYTGDIVIPEACLAVDKVTEIFSILQALGLNFPSANESFAEVDAESNVSYYDEVTEASQHENDKVFLNEKSDNGKDISVVNLDDVVNITLDNRSTLDNRPIAMEETDAVCRRLPRSSSKKPYKCRHCGRSCSSLTVLREHYSISHDCIVPVKPMTSADKIQRRLSRRGLIRKHPSCWICGRVCSSLVVLKEHFALRHSTEDQSVLGNDELLRSRAFLCQKKTNSLRTSSLQSVKKHTRYAPVCAVSGKACLSMRDLNEHSLVHGGVVTKQGREDADVGDDDLSQYICEVCGKVCSRPSALASHRRFHDRGHAPSCTYCGQTFTMRKNLVRHQRRHTGELGLICELCGRSFLHGASLRDHKLRLHRDEVATQLDSLSFRCRRCGERFSRISLLRQHIVETHRTPAPKERSLCTLCGRSFSCNFTLSMHMRLHTGVRPHRCDQCDRSFPTRAALRQHAFQHSNNYPHVCATCGKCFAAPSTLANHERVHCGVKPFSCDRCGQLFTRRCYLKQHVVMSHVEDQSLQCSK